MATTGSPSTSHSLIVRAKSGDPAAWDMMENLYAPLVYRWARRAGLQESDASDIMQDVFCDLAQGLAGFRKDKAGDTFRGWLWVITRNRVRRFYQARHARPAAMGGSDKEHVFRQLPDAFDADREPDESQSTTDLVHRALELIRADFKEHTWQAFWSLTVAGHSAADVGRDLGISEKAVRQAKYRVLCRLRQILGDN